MSTINETLIRDVVAEVMGRLGQTPTARPSPPPSNSAKESCGCNDRPNIISGSGRAKLGVFQDAAEACAAAHAGFLQLREKGVAARSKIVDIVKTMAGANAAGGGRIDLEE